MIHIGKMIATELHRQKRSVTWFANKLYCDRTNVYSIFKRKSIDTELLLRISHILNHNFFDYYIFELEKGDFQNEDNEDNKKKIYEAEQSSNLCEEIGLKWPEQTEDEEKC